MEERLLLAELVAVTDRTANDATEHIAAPFVVRDHAFGDEEADAAHDQRGAEQELVAGFHGTNIRREDQSVLSVLSPRPR